MMLPIDIVERDDEGDDDDAGGDNAPEVGGTSTCIAVSLAEAGEVGNNNDDDVGGSSTIMVSALTTSSAAVGEDTKGKVSTTSATNTMRAIWGGGTHFVIEEFSDTRASCTTDSERP
jgi:hypothetical protein